MANILKGDKAVAFERWEAPDVDFAGSGNSAEQDNRQMVCEQELSNIHQQAHAKGYQMGRWEGMNAGKEESDAQSQQFETLMRNFTHPFEQLDNDVQQELVLLATAIASQLVHREITTHPSVINHIVAQALTALHDVGRRVDIHLHPSDAMLVRDVIQSPNPDQEWHLIEDASLRPSDVRISSNDAFIDASLRTRIASMVRDLVELEPKELNSHLDVALSTATGPTFNSGDEAQSVEAPAPDVPAKQGMVGDGFTSEGPSE